MLNNGNHNSLVLRMLDHVDKLKTQLNLLSPQSPMARGDTLYLQDAALMSSLTLVSAESVSIETQPRVSPQLRLQEK